MVFHLCCTTHALGEPEGIFFKEQRPFPLGTKGLVIPSLGLSFVLGLRSMSLDIVHTWPLDVHGTAAFHPSVL